MAELVPGGEKDSVVYLGKSSFKMKVGVRMTPPAGTAPAPTEPPAPRITQTPRPWVRTPRPQSPQSGSHSRPVVAAEEQLVRGVALAKSTLIGLCLTAFSCGIMCTVAVDRYWPRARAECVGTQPGATHAAAATAPVTDPPAPPAAAAAASAAEVTSLPPYGQKILAADKVAAAEVEVGAAAVPEAATPPPAPPVAAAPSGAPRTRPVSLDAASPPALRGPAAPVRLAPAQGRAVVRKRPAGAAVAADKSSSSPATETWTDPFAE